MTLPPRTMTLWIAAAVWIALTVFYITTGFQSDAWLNYQGIPGEDQSYPRHLVATFSSISGAETAVLLLLARPWIFRGLWWRLLATFILFSLWTTIWVLGLLHQPPVQGAHLLWLIALVPTLLIALIGVSVVTWVRSRRPRAPGDIAGKDV